MVDKNIASWIERNNKFVLKSILICFWVVPPDGEEGFDFFDKFFCTGIRVDSVTVTTKLNKVNGLLVVEKIIIKWQFFFFFFLFRFLFFLFD